MGERYNVGGAASALPYPALRQAWSVLGVLLLVTILAYLNRQLLTLLVTPIRRDLKISDVQVGLLQGAAFVVFFALAGLPIGQIVDRFNRCKLLALGICVWSVMSIGCGFARNFVEMFAARMGVGLGVASLLPAAFSLIADLFQPAQRGRAMGAVGVGMVLGSAGALMVTAGVFHVLHSAPLISVPLIGPVASWRFIFVLIGLPGLPIALLMLTIREPVRHGVTGNSGHKRAGLLEFARYLRKHHRTLGPVMITSCLIAFAGAAAAYWGPVGMMRHFRLSAAQVGLPFGVASAIGGIFGPILGGIATDRWLAAGRAGGSRLALFVVCVPIAIIGAVMLAFSPNSLMAFVGVGLVIFGGSALSNVTFTATQDLCPNEYRGQAVALTSLNNNLLGVTLGPVMVPLVARYIFDDETHLLASLGIVTVPIFALSLLLASMGIAASVESAKSAAARKSRAS